MRYLAAVVLLVATSFAQTTAQQVKTGCASVEAEQFNFWVGDWDLTWPAQQNASSQGKGSNHVRKTMDDCVVEEQFQDATTPFRGMSVSTWNSKVKRWQQTWVDNTGSYLDFAGGFAANEMVLAREAIDKDGKPFHQRMVFKNIKPDSFDWSWERSDDGKSWTVVWPIHYQRKQ